jgi:hypothetical protein
MDDLYSLNTPLVIAFLAFVLLFLWTHRKPEGR